MIFVWPAVGSIAIIVLGVTIAVRHESFRRRVRSSSRRLGLTTVRDRYVDLRNHLVESVGSVGAYLLIVSAALAPIVIVCFALGMLATHEPLWSENMSLYGWFQREGPTTPLLLRGLRAVSWLGEWRQVVAVSAVAAVVLSLYARRRRWLAPALIASALIIERDVQLTIGWFVHQPHPPTTLASYPSGGVARVIAIYGSIAFLYLHLRPRPSWGTSVLAWTFVALFAFLMGYARAALLLHWPFDILGGWVLGGALLAVTTSAARVFDGSFLRADEETPYRVPTDRARDRVTSVGAARS